MSLTKRVEESQAYCLKWNNYAASVTSTFKNILDGEDFVDVSLVSAQGTPLKAHRVVLAACSVYFREILKGLSLWQHPVIVLKDVPFSDLQGIIQFIYHGEVSVDQEALPSLLKSAEILKVKGLTEEDPPPYRPDDQKSSLKNKHHIRKNAHPTPIRPSVSDDRILDDSEDQSEEPLQPDERVSTQNVGPPEPMEEEIDDAEEDVIERFPANISKNNVPFPLTASASLDTEAYSQILTFSKGLNSANSLGQKKTCPHCYQQLSWHALSRHVRDMHRHQSNYVSCKVCHKIFRNKNSLGCHMWRFHKESKESTSTAASASGSNQEQALAKEGSSSNYKSD